MKKHNINTNKYPQNNTSTNNSSDIQSIEIESSVIEINDSSIVLYSAIQSVWNDYQSQLSSYPCLDILANLASEETIEENNR